MKSSNHVFNFLTLALLALSMALILPSQQSFAAGGICVYPFGDINEDKVVDWTDLGLMADKWLQVNCDDANGWCGGADLDESANVDFVDYALLAANWEAVGICPSSGPIVISTSGQTTLGSNTYQQGDLIRIDDPTNPAGTNSLYAAILGTARDLDAVHVQSDGKILLSITGSAYTLGGVSFRAGDIVRYNPSNGATELFLIGNTSTTGPDAFGNYTSIFRTSAGAATNENVTNLGLLPNGHILLSTAAATAYLDEQGGGLLAFQDEDVVEYDPVAKNAVGVYFDATPYYTTQTNAFAQLSSNEVLVSVLTTTTIGGTSYTPQQIVKINTSTEAVSLFMTLPASQKIDAIYVNTPPAVDAGTDQQVTMLVGATLADANICGTAMDDGLPNPPGAVTQQWSVVSGPNDVTFADANALCTTASFAGTGVYVLRLTADDSALQSYDEVQITVVQNIAPTVDAGSDQQIVYSYPNPTNANLDGTVTDDGLPNPPGVVTTLWTQESGPGTVTFVDANAVDTNATFPDAGGVFILRLTANDGDVNSYDEVQITVVGKPGWSESANYYVDGVLGNDNNAGTSSAPFKTIGTAISLLGNDKKVLVWGGGGGGRPATQTYSENLVFGNGATSGHQATVKRDPNSGTAVIQGDGSADVINSSKGYITLDGFKITGGGANGVNLLNTNATGWIIKNCRVTGNTTNGIRFYKCANNTVDNCAVYANATGGGSYANIRAEQTGSTGHTVRQTTVYGGYFGIEAFSGSATITTVIDCIVSNCSSFELRASSGTITPPTYCDVFGTLSGVTLGANCKTTNPLLIDPDNGNFHIPSNSPAYHSDSGGGDMGYIYSDTLPSSAL